MGVGGLGCSPAAAVAGRVAAVGVVEELRQWLKDALAVHLSRINRNRAATHRPIRERVLRHRSKQQ
jgi:hypothetical protein